MLKSKLLAFIKNFIYDEGVTPLKWKIILPIFFTTFFSSMVLTMVFPFLPKLIKSFGVSEVDAGYIVGIVGATVFVGRFFGSFIWGLLSDRFNRKNVAIASGLTTAITTLAFGFTTNYTWTVVTRLLQGLSSGSMVTAITMVREMTDDTNRPLGMAAIVSSYNSATIVGASLGGYLAFPVEQYPNVFQGVHLFEQFGVLLPCLVPFACLLISSLAIWIWVPKSVKKPTHYKQMEQEESMDSQSENKVLSVLRKRDFVSCAILFGIYSCATIGYDELFPIYAATSKRYHGFGFSTSLIGTCLFVVAVVTLIMQFTLIPKIVRRFGPRKIFMCSSLMKALLLPVVPIIQTAIENEYLFWTILIPCLCILKYTMASSLLSINLLISNSVDFSLLGTANGISLSLSTLGRGVSVVIVGALYSWSLTNIKDIDENHNALGFPFDHHFVFLLFAVISFSCTIYSLLLPKSLDHSYKPRPVSNNDGNEK